MCFTTGRLLLPGIFCFWHWMFPTYWIMASVTFESSSTGNLTSKNFTYSARFQSCISSHLLPKWKHTQICVSTCITSTWHKRSNSSVVYLFRITFQLIALTQKKISVNNLSSQQTQLITSLHQKVEKCSLKWRMSRWNIFWEIVCQPAVDNKYQPRRDANCLTRQTTKTQLDWHLMYFLRYVNLVVQDGQSTHRESIDTGKQAQHSLGRSQL